MAKINDKTKLTKLTAWYKSKQEGSKIKHLAERHRDGLYTCFCPGDVYGVQKGNRCWHVKRLKEWAIKADSDGKYNLPPLDRRDYTEDFKSE